MRDPIFESLWRIITLENRRDGEIFHPTGMNGAILSLVMSGTDADADADGRPLIVVCVSLRRSIEGLHTH